LSLDCNTDVGIPSPDCMYQPHCACNVLGYYCEPCGCGGCRSSLTDGSDGGIFSIIGGAEQQTETSDSCKDYHK
jgi:hypothetical protein